MAHLRALYASSLSSVVTVAEPQALASAKACGDGPLAGVPLLVKDIFDTAGIRTTYGSSIYRDHVPDATAAAVARLVASGAVVLGKANLHEFAWGTTSQNPHWGHVQNPVHPGHIPGGSSGGNAASLAANLCLLGLGSDTGGSVRIPSACCGTVGLKPRLGAVSREGCFALCPTLDTVGPMARSVADCALAHSVLTGDAIPSPDAKGLIVGFIDEPPSISPKRHDDSALRTYDLSSVVKWWEALDAKVTPIRFPLPSTDLEPIFLREAAGSHLRRCSQSPHEYGADVRAKLAAASKVSPSLERAARLGLPAWRRCVDTLDADILVSPVLGIDLPLIDVWEPDVTLGLVCYTRAFNYLGWSAIAVRGMQIAGRDDTVVLRAALAWEQSYGLATPGLDVAVPA